MTSQRRPYRLTLEQLERLDLLSADPWASPFGELLPGPFDPEPASRHAVRPQETVTPTAVGGDGAYAPPLAAGPSPSAPPPSATGGADGGLMLAVAAQRLQARPLLPRTSAENTIHKRGADDGEMAVQKDLTRHDPNARGNYSSLRAQAENSLANPTFDRHILQHGGTTDLSYAEGRSYSTNTVSVRPENTRFYSVAWAQAKTTAYFLDPITQTWKCNWTPDGSTAWIWVERNVVHGDERASAFWRVIDPVEVDTYEGETITVGYTPDRVLGGSNAWNWHFPAGHEPGYEYGGRVLLRGTVTSNYNGWNFLFTYNIQFGNHPNALSVSVASHPGLGWNDQSVASQIRGRFSYSAGDWTFDATSFNLLTTAPLPGYNGRIVFLSELEATVTAGGL